MTPPTTLASRIGSATIATPSDTEIVMTRDFAASPERLYEAWTTPELVQRWWAGPEDEWLCCDIDLRVGGRWRWATRHTAEDGTAFEVGFYGVYLELEPPHRLAWTEMMEGVPGGDESALRNVMTFTRAGDLTRMVQTSTCPSPEIRDMVLHSGMETGAQAICDRLDELTVGG